MQNGAGREPQQLNSMRNFRPFFFALVLVAGFYLYTTSRMGSPALHNVVGIVRPEKLEVTEAATGAEKLDAEEQNNIEVYRRVVPAVVNITSRVMSFDFFYGAVPAEGQCSGFIIDKEGHIVTNFHCVQNANRLQVTLHNNKRR